MSQSTSFNQVFSVGDYVRTSKGKIGVIENPQRIEVGYNKTPDGVTNWKCLQKFSPDQQLEADIAVEKWQWSYPYYWIESKVFPNQVKLGSRVYPIWSDKLTKLDKLTIKTQNGSSQHVVTLPIEDAKLLIGIYTRNNIWFAIV